MNYANISDDFPKFPTILFAKIHKFPAIYFLKIHNSPTILSLDSPPVLRNTILKAILSRFYEQNNLHAFKQIFIDQYEFAVREYF